MQPANHTTPYWIDKVCNSIMAEWLDTRTTAKDVLDAIAIPFDVVCFNVNWMLIKFNAYFHWFIAVEFLMCIQVSCQGGAVQLQSFILSWMATRKLEYPSWTFVLRSRCRWIFLPIFVYKVIPWPFFAFYISSCLIVIFFTRSWLKSYCFSSSCSCCSDLFHID